MNMKYNALMYKILLLFKRILALCHNKSKKYVPFVMRSTKIDLPNTLTYLKKLIAAGMDLLCADIHAEICIN